MLRSAACATLLSLPAFAAIYESPITAEDEDDLRAAAEREEISDATLDTLLELMQDGVDLNNANREELYELPGLTYADVDAIVAYRKSQRIDDPAALVAAGAITAEQLLQIAPFILISDEGAKIPFGAKYHFVGNYTVGDPTAPPLLLQINPKGPFSLSGGLLMMTTRRVVGWPGYDDFHKTRDALSNNGSLTATPRSYKFDVPKFYLQWKHTKFHVVAGTFRIGFAQRLTLDNTVRVTPNGVIADDAFIINRNLVSVCNLSKGDLAEDPCPARQYFTDDFIVREPFRGVAAEAEDLELGDTARMSLYAFGSFQTRELYQYHTFSHLLCDDPRSDSAEQCGAPNVFVNTGEILEPKFKYTTIPAMFDELAVGGRAALTPIPMLEFGVTGYFAMPFWRVPQLQLDFQEYAKYPFGGPWGVVGLDGRITLGAVNLFFEGARSFDRELKGGGGWGAIERTVWATKKRELEVALRFYDIHYVNPYARPPGTSLDQFEGQRARNETGLLLKYVERAIPDFEITPQINVWANPWDAKGLEADPMASYVYGAMPWTWNIDARVRAEYTGWNIFEPSLTIGFRDKDIGDRNPPLDVNTGRKCYSLSGRLCTGERAFASIEITTRPWKKKLEITLAYRHGVGTSNNSDPEIYKNPGQDLRASIDVRSYPLDWLLLRLHTTYANADLFAKENDPGNFECVSTTLSSAGSTVPCREVWTYVEVGWVGWKPMHVTARYDARVWLDKLASGSQNPNPEHRLRLELEGRF